MSTSTPLFEHLAQRLTEVLPEHYRVGDRLPPESELCRRFEVSITTLREALAILHSQGIIQKRHGSGNYFSSSQNRDRHVAVLIPWRTGGHTRMSPSLQVSVEKLIDGLTQDRQPFKLYLGRQQQENNVFVYRFPELHEALGRGTVSLAIKFMGRMHPDTARALANTKVLLCGNSPSSDIRIAHDLPGGIRKAVAWLAARGRSRIAYMDVLAMSEANVDASLERFSAYCEALCTARLSIVPDWVQRDFHPAQSGAGWSNVREIWTSHTEKPDALILSSETFLDDASEALRTLGIKIPEQLLLVSQKTRDSAFQETFPCAFIKTDPDAYVSAFRTIVSELAEGKVPESGTRWIETTLDTDAIETSRTSSAKRKTAVR